MFERGAQITRRAKLSATPGGPPPRQVIAAGLPLGILDDSVRVTAKGAVATSATVILEAAGVDPSLPEALPESLRAARRQVALAEGELERLRQELDALESSPLVVASSEHQPPAPWAKVTAARRALLEMRQKRRAELLLAVAEAGALAEGAGRALAAAQDADRRRSSARSARTGELRKSVVIDLEVASAGTGSGDSGERSADEIELTLEYAVYGARWAPSYVARYAGGKITWTMRAQLSQQTGEDWRGVALRVSTAALDGTSELPELAALKIGKKQQAVQRRLRPPPPGVDELFADLDRDMPRSKLPEPPRQALAKPSPEPILDGAETVMRTMLSQAPMAASQQAATESSFWLGSLGAAEASADSFRASEARRADDTKVQAKKRAAAMKTAISSVGSAVFRSRNAPAPGYGATPELMGASYDEEDDLIAEPTPSAAPMVAEMKYVGLMMAGLGHPRRGYLVEMSIVERYRADGVDGELVRRHLAVAQKAAALVDQTVVPPGFTGEWSHDFDYAIDAEGKVDVPSDGGWHSLPLQTRSAAAKITHVAVPREATEVFRVATGENPFEAPILPGPVDVYDGDRFLVTAPAPVAAAGGQVVLPLGVDSSIRLARNSDFREEITGMLRGGLRLIHDLKIEVQNNSAHPIELEVRERVPVPRQKDSDDIAVEVLAAQPAWQAWTPPATAPYQELLRGGYRWQLQIAARATAKLSASYEVRIAGKHELRGGNRREP